MLRDLEPEYFYSFPKSYSEEQKINKLETFILSENYYFSRKWDGNYTSFVCDFDGEKHLLTRGISKATGEYGRVEDKVFFFETLAKAFNKPTKIIGETYFPKGIDRNVGSVLRAKEPKAKSIQSQEYYEKAQKKIKFSAKDRRDIEGNAFFNKKLHFRILDVWYFDGEDLMNTPWIERQAYVKKILERVNSPLIEGNRIFPLNYDFYDIVEKIFQSGGEGAVIVNKNATVSPGARTAWKTLKWKQSLKSDIDCFVYDIEPATQEYTGKDIENHTMWYDIKNCNFLEGKLYETYKLGKTNLIPVTRNYFHGWCGAIKIGVYDENKKIVPIGKVAGLTDEEKINILEDWDSFYLRPLTVSGMMLNKDSNKIRIRHPIIKNWRDGDLNIEKDCTLSKIKLQF